MWILSARAARRARSFGDRLCQTRPSHSGSDAKYEEGAHTTESALTEAGREKEQGAGGDVREQTHAQEEEQSTKESRMGSVAVTDTGGP